MNTWRFVSTRGQGLFLTVDQGLLWYDNFKSPPKVLSQSLPNFVKNLVVEGWTKQKYVQTVMVT